MPEEPRFQVDHDEEWELFEDLDDSHHVVFSSSDRELIEALADILNRDN